jgi:phosphate butyryltransferase
VKSFAEVLKTASPRRLLVAPCAGGQQLHGADAFNPHHVETAGELTEAFHRVRSGRADMVLQGDIPLADFFSALEDYGARRDRMCFVSLFEDGKNDRLLFLADTYLHDQPALEQKIAILRQVVALARTLGLEQPKAAVLSAIETVNTAIPSTVEAAVLSKMSERRQFQALVEGPLDIDAVLSADAARRKGVHSQVPGQADIILCPDVETGYALSQAFTHIGCYPTAGLLLGAPVPVIINPDFIPREHKAVEAAVLSLLLEGDKNV